MAFTFPPSSNQLHLRLSQEAAVFSLGGGSIHFRRLWVSLSALPHFWCNPAADWRNPLESREPLCDRFAWGFSVCGDFFEVSVLSFAVRCFRRHTLPSPWRARRSVHRVLRAAVSPAAGTAAIPGS